MRARDRLGSRDRKGDNMRFKILAMEALEDLSELAKQIGDDRCDVWLRR